MLDRRFFAEGLTLVGAAILCAVVANLLAAPERKLEVVGDYPNARSVPNKPASAGSGPGAGAPGAAVALEPYSAAELAERFPPAPETPSVEIGSEEAARLHASDILFLDARRTAVYAEGHIAGAQSFPIWETAVVQPRIEELAEAAISGLRDLSAPIVVYCSGGECEDSHMLAEKLHQIGFDNVLIYVAGFPDWEAAGRPVAAGGA